MGRKKYLDTQKNNNLNLQEGEEEGLKAFNKALSDLELISNYERLVFINRSQKNYRGWISVLQSWINKLSPDISKEDLLDFDNKLKNCKQMIGGVIKNYKDGEFEDTLDEIERKLFWYQSKLGIDNPAKKKDDFFDTEEEW